MSEPVDFRVAAKNAGYALVPEADLVGLNADRESLKTIRSHFPEEARGKEGGFIKSLSEKAGTVDGLQEQLKGVDAIKTENGTLKTQNADLTRGKKLSDMWGHVSKIAQIRNVRVHDRFIDEQKLGDFPLDKYDLGKEEGLKKFTESVWKDVLEPAHKEQTSVIEQVNGGNSGRSRDTDDKGRDKSKTDDSRDDEPAAGSRVFGGQA